MKKEQNNAGFSLVEVILAMAILAILAIPLLNYFVESMKYNVKMAEQQHATILAQRTLEDLKNQDKLIQLDGAAYGIPYLTSQNYVKTTALDPSDPFLTTGIGSAGYYGAADQIGQKYDVVVKMQSDTAENNTQLPMLNSIDDTCDILAAESGQYEEALAWFRAVNASYAANHSGAAQTVEQIRNHMVRTIATEIKKDGSYYRVTVHCSYTCINLQGNGSSDSYQCADLADQRLQEVSHIYYLFRVNQENDHIVIIPDTGVSVSPELYVVCQNLSSVNSSYKLHIKAGYNPTIYTNIGKDGNMAKVMNENTSPEIEMTDTKALVTEEKGIRKINIEVQVFQKGKGQTAGEKPYITVNAAKGE